MLERLNTELNEKFADLSFEDRISLLAETGKSVAFSTSLSLEDQVITHVVASRNLPIRVFTLDTGRVFEAVHETQAQTEKAYPTLKIETFTPERADLEQLLQNQGANGFYQSKENRHACCHVRKVLPLARALDGADIWISGLRREQSDNRGDLPFAKIDEGRGLVAVYPIIDLTETQIRDYIKMYNIPYNPMHDNGYPSIGCAPCTTAVAPGEHARAGRWRWENDGAQECGLHFENGKLVRAKATV